MPEPLDLKPAWVITGHPDGDIVVLQSDRVLAQMVRDAVQARLDLADLRTEVDALRLARQQADEHRAAAERERDALRSRVDGAMLEGMRLIADAWAGANRTAAEWRRWEELDSPDKILSHYAPESPGPELGPAP